jgi:hypothetical protein
MLCDVGGSLDRRALVAALKAVQGVLDADVAPGADGGLGTLRLDLAAGVDEAAVAGQVSRVLREQFGLGVDADKVELVEAPDLFVIHDDPEPEPELAPEPALPAPPAAVADERVSVEEQVCETTAVPVPGPRSVGRPSIAKMHLVSAGLDVTASVTLASGARTATGESRGLASPSGVHRAVAVATLRAVEELVGEVARVELEHLEITPMGTERTVVVLLTLLTAQGSEHLTGAAAVRDDVRQAVIRATLDALNRRLELLLTEA